MLARKRGGQRDRGKKMAKKGAAAALQTDVTTDEEWKRVLERPGLVLVDVYCEWSGPCTAMISVLKKIKMEMGGDVLTYATARCDRIKGLSRFRGQSEPTWMFVRGGRMINILFGANCPEVTENLIKELKRAQKDEPPDMSLVVNQECEKETLRRKLFEENKRAREAEKNAKADAKARQKYEDKLQHFLTALEHETIIIFFPWVFKDEEGNPVDKKYCAPYAEFVAGIIPGNFSIEQEIKKHLTDADLDELEKETDYELCPETRRKMMEDKSMILRLKIQREPPDEMTIDTLLQELVFGEPHIPESPYTLIEDSFVSRHLPQLQGYDRGEESGEPDSEILVSLTLVWVPLNPRNKTLAVKHLFQKYCDSSFPFAEEEDDTPFILFKYDPTKSKDVKKAIETYKNDVLNFGIFERDKVPEPKFITKLIDRFDYEYKDKTGYECFVAVVKKENPDAFLTFAGIAPYHISENTEAAIEEAEVFFPKDVELDDKSDDDKDIDDYDLGEGYEGEGYEDDEESII